MKDEGGKKLGLPAMNFFLGLQLACRLGLAFPAFILSLP